MGNLTKKDLIFILGIFFILSGVFVLGFYAFKPENKPTDNPNYVNPDYYGGVKTNQSEHFPVNSNNIQYNSISTDKVYVIAEGIIKNKLKSPSTANFPYSGKVSQRDDGVYVVMSYVDAQNSYGAKIRQYWICQLIYKGGDWNDDDNWQIIEATFM